MASKKKATKKSKGGMTVFVARLSAARSEINIPRGSTLRTALLKAGYAAGELEGMLADVRVNQHEAELGQRLRAADFITVAPKVEGGQ